MEFATTTELNQNTNAVLKKVVEDKGDVVLTKNGKPVAMIIPTTGEDLEEHILIKYLGLDKEQKAKDINSARTAKSVFSEIRKNRRKKA